MACVVRNGGGHSITLGNNSYNGYYLRCSFHCVSLEDRAF